MALEPYPKHPLVDPETGEVSVPWQQWFTQVIANVGAGAAGAVTSVYGRSGAVVANPNDYTWNQIDKSTSSLADLATRLHASLTDIGSYNHSTIDAHINDTTLHFTSASIFSGFTTGSIFFKGASGLAEDNANFFWDDTNKRLGIGTPTPGVHLDIVDDTNNVSSRLQTDKVDGNAFQYFKNDAIQWNIGVNGSDFFQINDGSNNIIAIENGAGANSLRITSSGNVGFGTVAPVAGLDAAKSVAFSGDISPSQITTQQDDYNPTGLSDASVLRLSTDASQDMTGLQGGADGRIILIHNIGSNDLVLKNEDASSSAANRFDLNADVTIQASNLVILQYDSTSSRWRAVAGGGGGGAGLWEVSGSNTQLITARPIDFQNKKAIKLVEDNSAVSSVSPVAHQLQTHTPTGRIVKMHYDGAKWVPLHNLSTNDTFVHSTGADTINKGTATGTDAYLTIQYALDAISGSSGGDATLTLSAESFAESMALLGKRFTGDYTLTIQGTLPTADDSGTSTSGTAWAMFGAGFGVNQASLVDTSKSWGMGTLADSGTTDGTTANKLVQSGQNFLTTVVAGMVVKNTTDTTYARVASVESNTTLLLTANIMVSGEAYEIGWGEHANKLLIVNGEDVWIDANFDDELFIAGTWDTTPTTDSYAIYDLETSGTRINNSGLTDSKDIFALIDQKNVIFKYIHFEDWHGEYAVSLAQNSSASFFGCSFKNVRSDRLGQAGVYALASSIDTLRGCYFNNESGTNNFGVRFYNSISGRRGDNIRNILTRGGAAGVNFNSLAVNENTPNGHGWVIRGATADGIQMATSKADLTSIIVDGSGVHGIDNVAQCYVLLRGSSAITNNGTNGINLSITGTMLRVATTTQINDNGTYGINAANASYYVNGTGYSFTGNGVANTNTDGTSTIT